MKKFLFLFFVLSFLNGKAQNSQQNISIIPAPNFYKLTGDSIRINGKVQVIFKNKNYSEKELKSAKILESAFNAKANSKKI